MFSIATKIDDLDRRIGRYIALFHWIWWTYLPIASTCAWLNLCTSLLYFVVRVRCHIVKKFNVRYLISWCVSCFSSIITVTLFAWKCCLCKKQLTSIFAQLAPKTQFGTLYAWNVAYCLLHYINIVFNKVLQAFSIILTNQCDMSKQFISIWSKQYDVTKQTLTWRENNFGAQSGSTL